MILKGLFAQGLVFDMVSRESLVRFREETGPTQQGLADKIGVRRVLTKRVASRTYQPMPEVVKEEHAVGLKVVTGTILLDQGGREPNGDVRLLFEAIPLIPDWEERYRVSLTSDYR
jgi:hypothetical protein